MKTIKRLGMEKEFNSWIKDVKEPVEFKVGDRVLVTRKAISRERGWENAWISEMDESVGKIGIIKNIYVGSGVRLNIPGRGNELCYPHFVLRKVKE